MVDAKDRRFVEIAQQNLVGAGRNSGRCRTVFDNDPAPGAQPDCPRCFTTMPNSEGESQGSAGCWPPSSLRRLANVAGSW